MVDQDAVRVLGMPPFHTTELTCSGDLSYLGSQWRRTVASVGHDVPLAGDIPAGTMIFGVPDVDPARRDALVKMLAIDLEWSMNKVSDGQRVRSPTGLWIACTDMLLRGNSGVCRFAWACCGRTRFCCATRSRWIWTS